MNRFTTYSSHVSTKTDWTSEDRSTDLLMAGLRKVSSSIILRDTERDLFKYWKSIQKSSFSLSTVLSHLNWIFFFSSKLSQQQNHKVQLISLKFNMFCLKAFIWIQIQCNKLLLLSLSALSVLLINMKFFNRKIHLTSWHYVKSTCGFGIIDLRV